MRIGTKPPEFDSLTNIYTHFSRSQGTMRGVGGLDMVSYRELHLLL